MKERTAIQPTRQENYAEWYQEVIKAADLAEHSSVRGCMVIKPWGYAIWENMQRVLDSMLKKTGHQNTYFPLFIPLSFLQKEAEHIEGFAKECAVVTHHRLEKNQEGKLVPAGELEEPLVVRPTSETIIGDAFSKWITSYRDLPLLINQWANVVRWEMRTRMFLRTTEFLWQEGHTAHATEKQAQEETKLMLDVYTQFAYDFLAIPVIKGEKTASERFPGAVSTYCIEAMMQDRKALQAGTSHFLGQNFAKASQILFQDPQGESQFAWTTSWGVSTRLIGALVMTHSDDDGLILPPRIASSQIVLLPVIHKEEKKEEVLKYCRTLAEELRGLSYAGRSLEVIIDTRDIRGGEKLWSWIKKGIPIRIEVGPRDIEQDLLPLSRRDCPHREKKTFSKQNLLSSIKNILDSIQDTLLQRALHFRNTHTHKIDTKEDFYAFFTPKNPKNPEIHAGFALTHFSEDPNIEEKIKQDLGVTIRCIPLNEEEEGKCPFTGKKSTRRVLFAKSY
ncbi:Proline--tRNA ligase [Candidatus Rhabdochlamydia oedothoracis]|uniref:Proline--tRNA ligase n=1 Tax=Candidatus Rhabdochlamydia oedothoracis TaxID=2720720 RepID=A0ABX8V1U5_9BACT|nr:MULTISPECIES: proline--tRNA ligase [Rhabdochlamydia]KAG6558856.1 Proline--tRNA ligase [Candidatus Rhabdochlamydia sp. W815]MCL6755954.1 proline--tRNA ligase [Candidatus Rhabdochlamydia oedothoracis]QYF49217.1 Proline--tRNA ligase [Candidatus Rhabdochlamydia oedothoracis]